MEKQSRQNRILVAADPRSKRFMKAVLDKQNATFAATAEEAQELLEQLAFDLVVASIYFDNFAMFCVLKATRQSFLNKKTTFVCIRTNHSSLESACDHSTFIALGALGADYYWNLSAIQPDEISSAQKAWLRYELLSAAGFEQSRSELGDDLGLQPLLSCRLSDANSLRPQF